MELKERKMLAGVLGFFVGLVCAPLFFIAAPFIMAVLLYNDEE